MTKRAGRDEAQLVALRRLQARVADLATSGPAPDTVEARAVIALIDDIQTLLSDLRQTRDEIGTELGSALAGQRAASAYARLKRT